MTAVPKFYDLARMSSLTTGTGSTITLDAVVAPFKSFAAAGAQNGDTIRVAIIDGTAGSAIGDAIYNASGPTLTFTTVYSTNSNNPLNLSGNAQLFITPRALDFAPISPGQVTLRYSHSAAAWVLYDENGAVVSTSGTTTSGLQEAINYAQTAGFPLDVVGPGTIMASPGTTVAVLACSTPVTINPITYWTMRARGCIIDFSGSGLATHSCLTIGTVCFSTIDLDCPVLCQSNAVHIVQIINNGGGQPGGNNYIQDNFINIRAIISAGGSQTSTLNISGVTYSINNNAIRVGLVDSGGFATFGVLISAPVGGSSGFVQNILDIACVTGSTQTEVQIGTGSVTGPIAANVWRFGGITPSESGMTAALSSYEFDGVYQIGSIAINAGSCTYGVFFDSGSSNNFLVAGQCDIGTPPVLDNGTNNTYFVGGASGGQYHVKLGVPTASTGLATGEIYANSGVLTRA